MKYLDTQGLGYFWAKCKARFAVIGHTHSKANITDFPSSMPASDVKAWAKASSKPGYTADEVGAADRSQQTPFVTGTQTAATGAWKGVAPTVDALYDGLTIRYWLPYAGSGNATLELTLSDGGTTGAINCYYQGTSRLTTHYPAGSVILLTYRVNVPVGGTTTYTGWWAHAQYDSRISYSLQHRANILAQSAIVGGNLIVGTDAGYKHLKLGTAFDIRYPILWHGSAVAAGSRSNSGYRSYYSFSISTTQSLTLTANKPIYIKGTLSGTSFTPASTAPLTQSVPTSADGYQYMLLGYPYGTSATNMYLLPEHPIFEYKAGLFGLYGGSGGEAEVASITAAEIDSILNA